MKSSIDFLGEIFFYSRGGGGVKRRRRKTNKDQFFPSVLFFLWRNKSGLGKRENNTKWVGTWVGVGVGGHQDDQMLFLNVA
jgi:hypothetical protein